MELPIVGVTIIAIVGWVLWLSVREWKRRKDNRYAGIVAVLGFIGVSAFVIVLGMSVDKSFRSARTAKERTDCVGNLNQVGRAMLMYLSDNNDRVPQDNWNAGLARYFDARYFGCPLLQPYGYTMSKLIVGRQASEFFSPARTVAVFDGVGGENSTGDEKSIIYRHNGAAIILYLDGHTRTENREMFEGLVSDEWNGIKQR